MQSSRNLFLFLNSNTSKVLWQANKSNFSQLAKYANQNKAKSNRLFQVKRNFKNRPFSDTNQVQVSQSRIKFVLKSSLFTVAVRMS